MSLLLGGPSNIVLVRSCIALSAVVSACSCSQAIGMHDRALHIADGKPSPSCSEQVESGVGWVAEAPGQSRLGFWTSSGRCSLTGDDGPLGCLDRASGVWFRAPGTYTILNL